MNESFEAMVLRVGKEIDHEWAEVCQPEVIAFARRIRDELCKEQEPTHWWNPKYATLTIQLTKPNDGGGWEPAYAHPTPIPADMVLVPREPTKAMTSAGYQNITVEIENSSSDIPDVYKAMITAYEKEQAK